MPIRINLLAEAQAAEELRRKDPVKRSIWIAGFAVFLVLLWSATLQLKISAVRSDIASLQANWNSIETRVNAVNDQRKRVRELEQKLSALDQFTTNRMLWANTLDALQHTIVDGVQLVRVHTKQTYSRQEGGAARTNDTVVIPGKPATMIERLVLTLEAKDFSAQGGQQVPRFKQALVGFPYFESNLAKSNTVQLTSLSAPQTDEGRTFVQFGFQLFFQETERQLYE